MGGIDVKVNLFWCLVDGINMEGCWGIYNLDGIVFVGFCYLVVSVGVDVGVDNFWIVFYKFYNVDFFMVGLGYVFVYFIV